MSRYVNPADVLDPDAKDLTEEEVKEYFHDSYRMGRVFIKDNLDPVYVKNKDGDIVADANASRPWVIVCEQLLKQPLAIDGNMDDVLYGYRKIRGPFRDEEEALTVATKIFSSHDSYSRMNIVPVGSVQPIRTGDKTDKEDEIIATYREEIESKQDEEDNFVYQQRQAEKRARQVNEEKDDSTTLAYYTKIQLRLHAAERKKKRAEESIRDAERVHADSQKIIEEMDEKYPNYRGESLEYYQDVMVDHGMDKPESFYDQLEFDKLGDPDSMITTEIKK